jgi:hypothetical protein
MILAEAKPVLVPLCPPQISHGLEWNPTQVSVARCRALTINHGTDVRAQPYQYRDHSTDLLHIHFRKPYCNTQRHILSTHI